MIEAAKQGHVEVVQALIEHDAHVNSNVSPSPLVTTVDKNALYHAAFYGHLSIVKILLEHGADILTFDKNGYTPLHVAVQNGHVDVVSLLLKQDINVDLPSVNLGETPLYIAIKSGYPELVELLLEKGADVNRNEGGRWTPLDFARNYKDVEIMNILLKHGAKTGEELQSHE